MSASGDDATAGSRASTDRANEERRFAPGAALAAHANVTAEAYERARADRLGFWAEQARRLTWATEPVQTLDWSRPPFAKWFAD
ncbi:acetyl-coenzyme A synthetase, partial [Streptomyces sp. SID11233]|nr:acetyl-coenzyme A synthetase [Streptomyces sp. SID11233]